MKRFAFFSSFASRFVFIGCMVFALAACGVNGTNPNNDVTAPNVTSTSPVDAASSIGTNSQVIAHFDEALSSQTLTAVNFQLTGPGTTPVVGTVSHSTDDTTVVFTPTTSLTASTAYTATLAVGIEDAAGNALSAAYVWTFTTAAVAAVGEPIFLGTAGDFAILAKAAISTTGTTSIVGDIGVSPAAQSSITGFSETLDASNQFATSGIVTGRIYAADMAPPTPAKMTSAIADMELAFTEAAGRTPDFTELGAGDISGLTLAPGTYKWGTGVLANSDVTLNGGANDVWIFQIAETLTLGTGARVVLTGDAKAENIFWQVAGQITLNTTAVLNGIALTQTAVVLETGAGVNGRLLAQTAVTLDANAVTAP